VKKALGLVLAVVFVLAIATPAFAQSMEHTATYDWEGDINMETQIGHLCNTGSEQKTVIDGEGKMTKVRDVAMVPWKTTVSDANDWVTAPDAVRNLTMTSVIELCAPPKYTYTDDGVTSVVTPGAMYYEENVPALLGCVRGSGIDVVGVNMNDVADAWGWEPVNDSERQIWAVQVAADPGYSGNIHQDYVAANGPYDANPTINDDGVMTGLDGYWGWDADGDLVRDEDFVGNYFAMEQMSRTSMGVHKRFIDISSPFSKGDLYEDMTVTGFSEVSEGFEMANIAEGSGVTTEWWDLF
jgi:hypothetical protein